MQLSSTLFGICVLPINPQIEKVLSVPPNTLAKEIRLNKDILEALVELQIPPDLLQFRGDPNDSRQVKVEAIKEHLVTITYQINEQRRIEEAKRLEVTTCCFCFLHVLERDESTSSR